MSGYQTSRKALLDALRQYNTVLEERKCALEAISRTSNLMKRSLSYDGDVNIETVLSLREKDIHAYAKVKNKIGNELDKIVEVARRCAQDANEEMRSVASSLLVLQDEHQSLAQDVLNCQIECENMLRQRLDSTAKAIRDSQSRRKLDAAYGPAVSHKREPVFLDKQR